ncbi:alpha/beta family hydrolase [Methylocaldum sp.]|uniref:alpha/beta family hydrolase n=1 Tax=Methylocaldum sp. TaxID=1969727 RepID=UPI002D6945BD|nr:alpha/beta family hydrolase [Methylocaldum sp.]HYE34375.1 alpha/beta family hydrolase [Methylocaldum sp.]
MPHETRKIQIAPDIEVSSVWAIPDAYRDTDGSAIILAHGAGNDMDHPFMSYFHLAFAEAGLLSVKFNFPYKEVGRKAPDRMPLLESTWRAVIRTVREDPKLSPKQLYLAGKSMGGRVASHVAAQGEACRGLVFLGYPLHPAKQHDKLRVEHWSGLVCPVLFVQGTRDALCDLDVLKPQLPRIPGPVTLQIVEGGDHSFKVPKSNGKAPQGIWQEVALAVTSWIARTNHGKS